MDYLPIGIAVFSFVLYAIMAWTSYIKLTANLLNNDPTGDLKGYAQSVPLGIAASGLGIGLLGGLYAYSQVNTAYVFNISIGITCLAFAISFGGLCIAAITH